MFDRNLEKENFDRNLENDILARKVKNPSKIHFFTLIKLYVGLTLDDLDRNLEKFDTFQNVPRLTFQGYNLVKNDQI